MEWSSGSEVYPLTNLRYPDDKISSALHFKGTPDQQPSWGGTQFTAPAYLDSSVATDWHTYQLWWSPDEIRIGVDGNAANAHLVYTTREGATNDDWPFDHPMDLIMNIAIGGNMGSANYPETFDGDDGYEMLVDYVRVYQGDWSAIPDTVAPGYTAAAEGVVALISDVYESETDTVWKVDGSEVSTVGLTAEDGYAFPNLHFVGIEPSVPFDLTAVDTFHTYG